MDSSHFLEKKCLSFKIWFKKKILSFEAQIYQGLTGKFSFLSEYILKFYTLTSFSMVQTAKKTERRDKEHQ